MHYIKLDHPEHCKHCLSRVESCPADATEYKDESPRVDAERCLKNVECLLCTKTCSTGAITPCKAKQD